MKNTRKGFTITELVIVIVVIAILAAVLIPTFSNLIKKANQSADIQAVRQMNTILAAEGAVEKNDIFDVYNALSDAGMSAENYKPLTADTYFFWDAELDRVLYVDAEMKVLFPKEYEDLDYTGRTWLSLTQKIAPTAPEGYVSGTTSNVEVQTGEELVYVLDDLKAGKSSKDLDITIPAEGVDMKGAAFDVGALSEGAGYDIVISGGPIKNATAVDIGHLGKGTDEHNKGQYGCALFAAVQAGNKVVISDVTFENLNVMNTNVSGSALLVGNNYGEVLIKNVTIKNSSVIAHRNVGALVGNNGGKLTLEGEIKLENVHVKTVGGRSAMLVGIMENATQENLPNKFVDNSTITMTNCTFGIYQCEQNAGTGLGLKDGRLYSTVVNADGSIVNKNYQHDASAWILASDKFDNQTPATARNSLFNNVIVN